MTDMATIDPYGVLTDPDTLTIQRIMPGPVERIWSYLTKSDLRAKWLAAGEMEMEVGTPFTLTWHRSELTDPPGTLPPGVDGGTVSKDSKILEVDPLKRLTFTWGEEGGKVTIELEAKGRDVLLTLTHHRLPERAMKLMICTGWHAHLDILTARMEEAPPEPFWDLWSQLRTEYDQRLPA